MKDRLIWCLILAIAPLGCASTAPHFAKFYKPSLESSLILPELLLKENEEPKIIFSKDIDADIAEIESNYFLPIGISGVNAPESKDEDIREAVKDLCKAQKAKLALYSYSYTDTRQGTMVLPQTYTSRSGNTTTATTIYSTSNYSIRRFDYTAVLFVPIPPSQIGFNYAPLTNKIRQAAERNNGVYVRIVYKDSNAFNANVIVGDIIIKMNNSDINNYDDMANFISKLKSGDKVTMTLVRNAKIIKITLVYA